jgi:co-chaperonin GroES (HSP10)
MGQKIIEPMGCKVIVFPIERKEEKIDSIIIPETANADLLEGEVVEVGVGVKHLYKAGDKVLFPKGAGVGQFYKGKPHVWLDGGDDKTLSQIWGVITREKE